jgi:hypothetical protein
VAAIETELGQSRDESKQAGKSARRFKDLLWRTPKSWSKERRVIAKAEWTQGEENPRFVVAQPDKPLVVR